MMPFDRDVRLTSKADIHRRLLPGGFLPIASFCSAEKPRTFRCRSAQTAKFCAAPPAMVLAGRNAMIRPIAVALSIAATLFAAPAPAQQTYPTRTVRLILPFGPASATDITARLFAD